MLLDSPLLPESHRAAAMDREIRWIFHQVSIWEIQIKYQLGKLPLPKAPDAFLPKAIVELGFVEMPIENDGIFMLGKLPAQHRDPFDRLLIAHALLHGWEIASTDTQLNAYPVRVL